MAVNDLMMKIQLLVESGKSSAELKRLQQALKALQNQLTALDRTQLTPLTRDLEAVKRAAASLKTVNLGNFATSIDEVKRSFAGLGVATGNLDRLKTAYQQLNTQLSSNNLSTYQTQLKTINDRLREAKKLTLTSDGQSRNTGYEQLNRDLTDYNNKILNATRSILSQKQSILGLKEQLAQLPKIKIDPTITTTLQELRRWANASGRGVTIVDTQKSFGSLQDFNTELAKQQGLYNKAKSESQKYQETLAKLRVESQRAAIPDLTMGGTRNLVRELEQARTKVSDLRTKELVPLQNLIRTIQSKSNFSKVFNVDPLKASVKVARAELAQLSLAAQETRKLGGIVSTTDETRMAALKQQIVDSNKKIADLELKAQQTSARNLAIQNQRLAAKQNELAVDKASFQNIQSLIASQKRSAQLAAQSVKTRSGGIIDTTALKAAAQAEANLYKNNLNALKQYLSERKKAATDDANLIQQQIQNAQRLLAQGQLTKAQYAAERAEIKANLAIERERSRIYQQTLRDQKSSISDSIRSEKERESSLRSQIKELTKLNTAEAQRKSLELQSQLAQSKSRRTDLVGQSKEIEQAAKAEIQRLAALDRTTNGLRQQAQQVNSLSRLFRGAAGPANEFFAAFRFMLGPQMAGFAAAGSLIGLASIFVEANKSVESLIRGLNAISGGQGVAEFEKLVSTSNRLGVSIQEASHSFLQLKAAAEGTGLEGEKIQKIFTSFANALNITGADSVTMNRAFRSISQMISKGQLYAEELKGQLAEALPGAIQVFARALDVTPKKLMALVKSGAIEGRNLERVLALVAVELDKTYKVANEQDFTFVQKANLAKNALVELFVAVGDTGVWDALANQLLRIRDLLKSLEQGVPGLSDTLKAEWDLISNLYGDGIQQLSNELSSLVPEIDFSSLKQELFDLPATVKKTVLGALGEIGSLVIDAEQIIKNFHERQKSQPGVQIPIELITNIDGLVQQASDVIRSVNERLKETGIEFTPTDQQSWWEQIFDPLGGKKIIQDAVVGAYNSAKDAINKPIEIKAEIIPITKDQYNQENEPPPGLLDRQYARYLKRVEDANQKIREQNTLAQQQNSIIEQNNRQAVIKQQALKESIKEQQIETQELLKQANAQRVLTAELRKQDEIAKRNRGSRNDILQPTTNVDTAAQQQSLAISKERARTEKEILDIQQAYQDNLLDLNSKKYTRWAEQGSITKEGAAFLIQSAKVESLRKSWNLAQEMVDNYNAELSKGDQASAEQLKNLSKLAEDQLKYADSKAKEVGDEYKLKQIMEARVGLLKSIQESSIDKLLTEAELKVKTQGKEEAKKEIDQIREYAAQAPAVLTIVTQTPAEAAYQLRNQIVPVTFSLPDTANTIQADWQQLLQSLPTPGFLTCPIEVDDTQVVPTVSNTLSDIQRLFGEQSFQFDTTQPIQSLDQLKYAFVSTQAQIVSASQAAQQNPITYTIKAANPQEQQTIEDRVAFLKHNPNLTVNLNWVTTGGQTVDGFMKSLEKKAVVTIAATVNPAQVAQEGAKAGQIASNAANQQIAQSPIKTLIETVVDQTSLEGWKRQVARLTAQDSRVPLRLDTAELDQEFRRIDGQLAEWNRTAGNGLEAGFVSASTQTKNFGLLVDQVNQKLRAIQNPQALPPVKPVIEPVVETKTAYQQVQEQLNQSNPITISANAAPLVGEIQAKLNELRASGATKIQVTLDETTGQLVITANTDPANEAVKSVIQQIEARDVVLRVRVVYSDPGYSNGSTSTEGEKKRWGGYISGYGGGDRIRALLEPGEFVLRKEAVKALGLSSLMKLNRQGFNAKIPQPSARPIDQVSIPRFANGGAVQGQPIVINIPGGKSIQVSGSRDSAMQLANLLTRVGRAV